MVRSLVIGILCLVAAGGCVVSVANQTPRVGYSQIVPREPRPSVSYTVRCLSGKDQREFMSILGLFPERLEPVLRKSQVFSRFTLGDASDDFQLVFVFHAGIHYGLGLRGSSA